MKQVFLSGKGEISVLDSPVPARLKGSLLVRNRYSLISSGTEGAAVTTRSGLLGLYEKAVSSGDRISQVWDMAKAQGLKLTYDAVQNKLADHTAIGYSCSGVVVEVDDDSLPFSPGDSVACMGAGFASHSEYVVVPRNLAVAIPAGVGHDQAAFAALACIAMQGVRRLELTPGERVGVVGLGLIGQITMRLLAGMGYRPYGMDLSSVRAHMAEEIPNCEAWAIEQCDSASRVLELTGGAGLDGVVVCAATESNAPVNLAFDLCRKSGRVSIVGDVGLDLERAKMYAKELDLRMSCSYGPGRYDADYELQGCDYALSHVRWSQGRNLEHFLWMLQAGSVDLGPLISRRFSIDQANEAYREVKKGGAETLGVLLDYGDVPEMDAVSRTAREETRVETGVAAPAVVSRTGERPIRVAVVGVGGYVKGMHLPKLKKLERFFDLRALVSRTGASAASAARRFKVPVAASDYRRVLDDPEIDAVLIATRHATHAKLVLDSLAAGKHVFVEKPMTTNVEDAERIVAASDQSGLTVRVGFNRRFSPHIHALRDAVGEAGIRMLLARVNVGQLSNDWSNTEEEGGRLLGEGVHFYDLANWFMGHEPVSLHTAMTGKAEATNPNASVLLGYSDGSSANVLYTSLGHKGMGKEYFEAFGNGRSVRMKDYAGVESWGARAAKRLPRGDKGQMECLREFACRIMGLDHPVVGADARSGLSATSIALAAVAQSKSRSPSREKDA